MRARPLFHPVHARGRLVGFLPLGAFLATVAMAAAMRPNAAGFGTHRQLGLPACPSAMVLRRPCPGCGLTTSWTATVHGDLGLGIAAHALGPLLLAAFAAWAFASAWAAWRGERLDGDHPAIRRAGAVLAIVFFGYGIARFALVRL